MYQPDIFSKGELKVLASYVAVGERLLNPITNLPDKIAKCHTVRATKLLTKVGFLVI